MTVSCTYDATLSRVRITADGLGAATTALVERSTNQITWATVRGGLALTVTTGAAQLDDYEFTPGVVNYYRFSYTDGSPATQTGSITPTLDTVWLKNLARPFLNRAVTVTDWSDVEQASRNGIFDIVGRTMPVAVTDVRTSRRYTLTVMAATDDAAEDLRLCLAGGDTVLLHVPDDCPVPGSMYAVVGDLSIGRKSARAVRRYLPLPLVECAAPGPDIVGATATWQTVLDNYATWADLLAAFPTWQDVLDLIAEPAEVIVE